MYLWFFDGRSSCVTSSYILCHIIIWCAKYLWFFDTHTHTHTHTHMPYREVILSKVWYRLGFVS